MGQPLYFLLAGSVELSPEGSLTARKLAIPSLRSLHRRTKCGVYHHGTAVHKIPAA